MSEVKEPEVGQELERRRGELVELWDLRDELVLVGAGELIPVPGRGDRAYPFRSHSEYFYLTDRNRPGGVLAYDPHEGWSDFVVPVGVTELLWSAPEGAAEGVPEGALPVEDLARWLEVRRGRRAANLGSPVAGVTSDPMLERGIRRAVNRVRRVKDEVELARMRTAERATSAGFAAVAPLIIPGCTERELQIELEVEFFRNGADSLAYESIIAGGPNTAVLHFAPTTRPFGDGELVLVDAGGEYRGYASDVTRTYPASGQFTPEQAHLHSVVLAANQAATHACKPGIEWKEIHRIAALTIGEGLADFGLLRGRSETLFASGAISIFFPHGVGHMVGLGVRDAGEVLRPPGDEPGFPTLRVDLPLEPGHTFTVEPGIYFVPAILNDPARREQHRDVDWDTVDRMLGFGGIRVEDNILITEQGCEVLTADVPVP